MTKMKNLFITLSIIAAILCSTPSHAQKIVKSDIDVNSVVPGMTLRPLNKSEHARLAAVKACNITACTSAVIAAAATVGVVAYDVEFREAGSKDFHQTAELDKATRDKFIVGAAASAGVCVLSAITGISIKMTLRNKTIVRASTGGFVIEF